MEDSITYYVYNLLHSMSHSLLSKHYLCGLDKNSLSEYILLIYLLFLFIVKTHKGLVWGLYLTCLKHTLINGLHQ